MENVAGLSSGMEEQCIWFMCVLSVEETTVQFAQLSSKAGTGSVAISEISTSGKNKELQEFTISAYKWYHVSGQRKKIKKYEPLH